MADTPYAYHKVIWEKVEVDDEVLIADGDGERSYIAPAVVARKAVFDCGGEREAFVFFEGELRLHVYGAAEVVYVRSRF